MIKKTNLSRLRLMDFYQVMSLVRKHLFDNDLAALQLLPAASAFDTAFEALDAAVKQDQKTGLTDDIVRADEQRDATLSGLVMLVKAYLNAPDAAAVAAAEDINLIIEKYGKGIAGKPLREETAIITNLLQDLAVPEVQAKLAKLHALVWTAQLQVQNQAFENLYAQRTEKEASYQVGLAKAERQNMQAAFEAIAKAINAFAYVNGAAAYQPLADNINREVARSTQAKGKPKPPAGDPQE